MLNKLQMLVNKNSLTKLLINRYNSLRFIKSKNKQIN